MEHGEGRLETIKISLFGLELVCKAEYNLEMTIDNWLLIIWKKKKQTWNWLLTI